MTKILGNFFTGRGSVDPLLVRTFIDIFQLGVQRQSRVYFALFGKMVWFLLCSTSAITQAALSGFCTRSYNHDLASRRAMSLDSTRGMSWVSTRSMSWVSPGAMSWVSTRPCPGSQEEQCPGSQEGQCLTLQHIASSDWEVDIVPVLVWGLDWSPRALSKPI